MTAESVCVLALFGGNRSNASKCGLSYWNVNNPATNVNTNIVASQSYQMTERLIKSTPFSYTAGCWNTSNQWKLYRCRQGRVRASERP